MSREGYYVDKIRRLELEKNNLIAEKAVLENKYKNLEAELKKSLSDSKKKAKK